MKDAWVKKIRRMDGSLSSCLLLFCITGAMLGEGQWVDGALGS